jgi:glycerophosphoryl diester phosphodiesterase
VVEGWFASRTARSPRSRRCARSSPFPERPQQFKGKYRIPTFDPVIALAKRYSRRTGRTIGI